MSMAIGAAMATALPGGRASYANKDHEQAWRMLKPLADRGDPQAQLVMADSYRQGLGVTTAALEAVRWYRKAAESGIREAQHALAGLYFEGKALPQDLQQAIAWWRRAAGAELAAAQYNLGLVYARGAGVDRDDRAAREWFEKSAGHGHAGAQFALGVIYAYGQGAERDLAKAAEWFRHASENGMPEAQYNLVALAKAAQESPLQETRGSPRKSSERGVTAAHETLARIRAPTLPNRIKTESWILARHPSQFTVQLATTTDRDTVISLMKSQTWDHDLAFFAVKGAHRAHYVIIYGVFETGEHARAALAQLPAHLLQAKPLVRSFRQVQEMMVFQ